MRSSKFKLGLIMSVLGIVLALAGSISAQTYKNERQVSEDLRRLQNHLNTFRIDLNDMLSRVRYREYQGEDPMKSLQDMETAYRTFNDNFRAKRETDGELMNLLQEAGDMNQFLTTISMGDQVNYSWSRVKNVLDQLASQYSVTWSWDGDNYSYSAPLPSSQSSQDGQAPVYSGGNSTSYSAGLSGTYRLNASESENARDVAERASMIIAQRDRDRIRRELEEKLTAPDEITIDVRGQQVFVNSSNGGQAVFIADGVDKYETIEGKNVRVRATLRGERLTITQAGSTDGDYAVTFESIDNGRRMRVSRRVNYSSMSQTVMAESVYDKTGSAGQVGNYPNDPVNNGGGSTGNNPGPTIGNPRKGDFIVPNGTLLSATLENEINTKISQNNDRFRMTVQSPNEYRGAIIEGYISGVQRSGRINSRAKITLNFEKIRMRNGQVYEFAGALQSFTDTNGEIVKVDNEGTARGDSQTKETVKRGGIGAGIGAVIGAVIGGAKGAIIGATIGAGAGAGSVYVQGRDDLELKPGSTVTVQATGPNNGNYR